jgi:hypothetical protein
MDIMLGYQFIPWQKKLLIVATGNFIWLISLKYGV